MGQNTCEKNIKFLESPSPPPRKVCTSVPAWVPGTRKAFVLAEDSFVRLSVCNATSESQRFCLRPPAQLVRRCGESELETVTRRVNFLWDEAADGVQRPPLYGIPIPFCEEEFGMEECHGLL